MILRMNRKINNTASFLPETSIASYVYIPSVKIPLSTIKLVEMKNLGNIFGYLRSWARVIAGTNGKILDIIREKMGQKGERQWGKWKLLASPLKKNSSQKLVSKIE